MNKNNGFDIDNKIKAIFNEEIEVPDIVNVKSKEAYDMLREIHNDKLQKNKMRSLKVVASVALISTLTITTTFAVEYIIDYFNQNKQSLYLSDKNDFEKTSNNINLAVKDKGIEFTIDNISIDDNYITVFHTSKIDKNINKRTYVKLRLNKCYIQYLKDLYYDYYGEESSIYIKEIINHLQFFIQEDVANVYKFYDLKENTKINILSKS